MIRTSEVPPRQVKLSSPTLTSPVLNENVGGGDVAGVGVVAGVGWVGGRGGVDRNAADGDVGGMAADGDVEHGGVLQFDGVDEDAIAGAEGDHAWASRGFICFGEGPPRRALAVDSAMAADLNIVKTLSADEIFGILRSAGIAVERQHFQGCAF